MSKKLNCWEYMNCGRGPKGRNIKSRGMCPAAREKRLDRIHGGWNSGRACWVVAGTYCGGTIQGSYARKHIACKRCDFYQKVHHEEGEAIREPQSLLKLLKEPSTRLDISTKRLGILLGGSGLIGGALMHYFKKESGAEDIEVLSPNSKKLSLREPQDIKNYCRKYQPDFIINCAITALNSDARMAYETNYLGSIRLAKMAMELKIPYIHFSSAAILPAGENITEEQQVELQPRMSNYAKSKLMAEKTLQHLHETQGLDYTIIRLAVVYGKHDHKIQGFHRLLFAIADQSMPFILSKPGVCHSYTHNKKIPPFVHYILENREEFTGQTYNFADPEPVELVGLIKAIKSELRLKTPREFYVPYPLARFGRKFIKGLTKRLGRIGVESRLPAEMMFMKNFYNSQTLNTDKLQNSSYRDERRRDVTVYTELAGMIEYYLTRWQHLNRISTFTEEFKDSSDPAEEFLNSPQTLLEKTHRKSSLPIDEFDDALEQ
jgi:nucleoside-diphosphate-sugar epimerase